MAEQLIATTGTSNNKKHVAVPTLNEGAVITERNGKINTSQTLPDKVQGNIDVEKIKFSDSTTNNASTGKHGLIPKLPNNTDFIYDGTGVWKENPNPKTITTDFNYSLMLMGG